jgi:hypothetical protein
MQREAAPRISALRTNFLRHGAALLFGIAAVQAPAFAGDDAIVTDRPDFVESSNVVGKGRFQIETSVAVDRSNNALLRERTVSTPTLLRYGIGDTLELRLETDGRSVSRSQAMPHGEVEREAGYADAALGVKWHVADAQGSRPSLGLLLHADLPSGSRALRGHGVRPSLRVAAEWELPDDFSLGVMPGLARDTDDAGRHYVHGIFGIVLGKELTQSVRGFVEIAAPHVARAVHGGTQATFDVGAAWLLSDSLQLDSMLSRGLNRRTSDLSWTVGLSFKR